jgi:hypothetical protein
MQKSNLIEEIFDNSVKLYSKQRLNAFAAISEAVSLEFFAG